MRLRERLSIGRVALTSVTARLAAWPWYAARLRLAPVDCWQVARRAPLARRLMEQTSRLTAESTDTPSAQASQNGHQEPHADKTPPRVVRVLLVRHGQATFNVEGKLPGQLPGVPLTDEGRRQASRAAIALAGARLTTVVSSPLERARETAEIIARGWSLPVREDPRLMDTDVGPWAGRKISDIAKDDPNWAAFLKDPTAPPAGVESMAAVQARAVAVVEEVRATAEPGADVVVVAHADVIKLIVAHHTGISIPGALAISIANASITALAFVDDHPPALLAANWTMAPDWLVAPAPRVESIAEPAQAAAPGAEVATPQPAAPREEA